MHQQQRTAPGPDAPPYRRILNRVAKNGIAVEHVRVAGSDRRSYTETIPAGRYRLLVALRRARTNVTSNGRELHAGSVLPGMSRFHRPGEHVTVQALTPVEAVGISIPDHLIPASQQDRVLGDAPAIMPPNAQVEQLARLLLTCTALDGDCEALFAEGLTASLLALVLDMRARSTMGKTGRRSFGARELTDILDFGEDHVGSPLGLSDWAAAFGLAPQDFARRFRAATGCAPYTWFLRRRVERAKDMLEKTATPLALIALDVGFCSQSHFSEAFQRIVGMPPGQWRRSCRPRGTPAPDEE